MTGVFAASLISLALSFSAAAADQWAYVWQQVWTNDVRVALRDTAPLVDGFMLLTADAQFDDGAADIQRPAIDWTLLADLGRPVVAVVRVNLGFAAVIDAHPSEAVDWIRARYIEARDAATVGGARLAGFQIDYDCPSERLAAYATLLEALAPLRDVTTLSITSLPDWLGRDDFTQMLAAVDTFILQVHGLDRPADIDASVSICDPPRARTWIAEADTLNTPFRVALPTYGYRLFFDRDGAFVGLGAEGTATALAGTTARDLHADPAEIGTLAAEVRRNPPRHCEGLAWFRMPVDGDTLNWSDTVWSTILRGDAVFHAVTPDLHWPDAALLEVYIENSGTTQPGACLLPLTLAMPGVAAYDTHNGFRLENTAAPNRIVLHGPSPPPGMRRLAAWFRFDESAAPAARAGQPEFKP